MVLSRRWRTIHWRIRKNRVMHLRLLYMEPEHPAPYLRKTYQGKFQSCFFIIHYKKNSNVLSHTFLCVKLESEILLETCEYLY